MGMAQAAFKSGACEVGGAFLDEGDDAFTMVCGAASVALVVAFGLHGVFERGVGRGPGHAPDHGE